MAGKKKLGLIIDTDHFIKDFIPEMKKRFDVRIYDPPQLTGNVSSGKDIQKLVIGHARDLRKIDQIQRWADITFFEWASRLLVKGTKKKKRCKVITRLHRYEVYYYVNKVDWSKIDEVIFVCRAMEKKFLEQDVVKKNFRGRTKVVWNYLDLSGFEFSDHGSTFQIGLLAIAQPRKRLYSLVLAHHMALKKHPNLVLRLAGRPADEEYLDSIKMLIKRLGIEDSVKLDGYVDDLSKWYRGLDIIVSNSTHESTNITLFEGAACGAYPISHVWDGIQEFLPEENLFTDAEDYVRVIDGFYS
ncbi:MAG: glycosyltransferase, partial [Candidatus Thermoplasmatota archaeon]|nr:glycosyltransferase [Candidatus Thermoplasmatota archaeon]